MPTLSPRRRQPPGLRGLLVRALLTALAHMLGLTVLLVTGSGPTLVNPPASSDYETRNRPAAPALVLMKRFDCSTMGYGDGAEPQSAIVRDERGRYLVVTFAEGWHAHVDDPGSLVAVCLEPPG